uniref:alpha-glucosidase n=1 Tax=Riptortus pedestris TaxID=329032 RepID=R4WCR6_RIPPE|nr:alpha-amylase [Riptortus pedestris]
MLLKCWLLFACLGYTLAELEWWKSSILYQIYPRSFADSNGDGNGDIKGIHDHIDYLSEIGVGVVWVSPIYKSPMKDMGYDISDWKDVNPLFGTLDDVKKLIDAFHAKGIKFFMDMVPNHSSDEHPWFNASRYGADDKKDFYVWKQPKGWESSKPVPPNNWISVFQNEKEAWTFDEVRREFYLHQFGSYQPDLNFRNPKVVDAMFDNMAFWLDMGVDGFRMDAVPFLVEDDQFRDEPVKNNCDDRDCLVHQYTQNLPETYKVLQDLADRMEKKYGDKKYMFLEAYADPEQTMKYYYKLTSPFNFLFIQKLTMATNATELKQMIDSYLKQIPNAMWPNWVVGNHDNSRVGTRLGPDFIDATNMLTLLLPGTTVTYQGEELGMTDGFVRSNKIKDCCGRDPERMPMQWDNSDNAGFSTSKNGTWLPVNTNYWHVNAKDEKANENSHLATYKRLASLRKELVESLETATGTASDWVFVAKRTNDKKVYYVIINLDNIEQEVALKNAIGDMPEHLVVHTPSDNAGYKIGDSLATSSKIILRPRSGIVASESSSASVIASLALVLSSLIFTIFNRH